MTTVTTLPLLGLMLGDPTGIGPEQCARVLADGRLSDAARLVVIGDGREVKPGAEGAPRTGDYHGLDVLRAVP